MTEPEHPKSRFLRNIISCVLYIIALSFVLVLFGIVENTISKRHSSPLDDPGYWIRQFQDGIYWLTFFITCQFIAASLIIKDFSLKKLFALTFVCIVINHWLEGLIKSPAYMFWAILLSIVLSYVVPVLILALIRFKKTPSSESEAEMQKQAIDDLKSKYMKYWYVLDIILIGFVLYWGTLLDPFGIVSYISGLYNRYNLLSSGFTYALLIVPASLCLLILIIRMIVSWPKYISNKSRLITSQILVVVCIFAYLVLPFLPIMPAPKRIYIAGFEGYVKKNADIDGIRNWLNLFSQEDFREYEGRTKDRYKVLEKQDRPEVISKLKPRSVVLSWDENYKPKVSLSWGSGVVGPWGFDVLNENVSTSASEYSYPIKYRHEIQNGVYVWCKSN